MKALLLSSALATVLAGVIQPGQANAACSSAGILTVTVTCSGDDANGFALNDLRAVTVNAPLGATVQTAPGGNAMSITSALGITSNNTGATFTGSNNGIVYTSLLSISMVGFSGSASGGTGDGIDLTAGTGVTYSSLPTAFVSGGTNGLVVNTGGTANVTTMGGFYSGGTGNGMSVNSVGFAVGPVATPAVTNVTTMNTFVQGGNTGISATASSIGLAGNGTNATTTVTANGGLIMGGTGDGIFASAITAPLGGGPKTATTTVQGSADITGGSNGIFALSGSLNGNANTTVDVSGDVEGTSGNGIFAMAASVGDLSGFNPTDPSTWNSAVGTGKATVNVETDDDVTAGNGTGILAVGIGTGNEVNVEANDNVEATGGFAVIAGSIGTGGTVNVETESVSGTMGGVLGFNTGGDTTVTTNGTVQVASGGLVGVGAISNNGNATVNFSGVIDPPLIGVASVAIGNGTAATNTSGSIDADVVGILALNVGNGQVDIDNNASVESSVGTTPIAGILGVKVGDNNAGLDVNVQNKGVVEDFAVGVAGVAVGNGNDVTVNNLGVVSAGVLGVGGIVIGDGTGTETVSVTNLGAIQTGGIGVLGAAIDLDSSGLGTNVSVDNSGAINGGFLGVAGVAIGTGTGTTVDVQNSGAIGNNSGIGVAGIGIGTGHTVTVNNQAAVNADIGGVIGIIGGDSGTLGLTNSGAITTQGVGVAGLVIGDNGQVDVKNTGAISGGVLGVGGVVIGDNTTGIAQTVLVNNQAAITNDGIGVLGGGIGDNHTVDVTTSASVNAGILGVGGFSIGANGNVDVTTTAAITSGGAGVVGAGIGDNSVVNVTTGEQVNGAFLGVGGLIGGTGSQLTILTQDKVISSDGFGVAGLGIGTAQTMTVTTEQEVQGDLLGVGALNLGGGGTTVTVETLAKVTSASGFGVLGGSIGTGANTVSVTTQKEVSGDLLGVGGIIGGTGGTLTVETKDIVNSANGFGVAALGIGSNTIDVTTEKAVTGRYLGVGALALGDTNVVTVHTLDTVTSADGFGVFGGAIGAGPNAVSVTTDQAVAGRLLGVGGILGANGGSLDIHTLSTVDSADGFGVAGLAFGNNNTVTVLTDAAVTGDLLGVGALSIGNGGTVDVHTLAAVTSASGIGVFGGNIGAGTSVTVVTDGTVNAALAGVVGINTGGAVDVTVNQKVTVAPGGLIGAAAIGGGAGNATLNINAIIDPPAVGGAAVTIGSGTATANVNAEVQATTIGIVGANIGNGAIDVNINAGGSIKSDGIGILTFKLGDGPTTIDVNGPIGGLSQAATGGDGILAIAIGQSPIAITTTANGIINAGDDGISVAHLGGGNIDIVTNGIISAGDEGIQVLSASFTTGDVNVTNNAEITAVDNGIFILKGGDGAVAVNANHSVFSTTANGIEANSLLGTGDVTVQLATSRIITAADFAIIATKSLGDGNVLVQTGTNTGIIANAGIFAGHFFGTGNTTVNTGVDSIIVAGTTGIEAQSIATSGDVTVNTGINSLIEAGGDGVVAGKAAGSGDVFVNTATSARIFAGDDAITATNFAFGPGNDVTVTTGGLSVSSGNDKGIRAGGWDNVTITTGASSLVRGDADTNGVGNGIRIFSADIATVNVGTNAAVIGSGKSWPEAVISIQSDDATAINVGSGALVSSWSYTGGNNLPGLIVAASDIVIDTDGGATTITNEGTIVGRIGLTDNDDVFNNLSSNTWVTVGANFFGAGTDTVNNSGRVITALQGAVAETTAFNSLETFNNGDPLFLQAGLLTMIDEVPGQIAFNGARDVTYVSGTWNGVGNSTVGIDSFLGAPGSTSDVLAVGGLDVNGVEIAGLVTTGQTSLLINDVNAGPGAFNLAGILVVDVQSAAGTTLPGSFIIDPNSANYAPKFGGVIDKGLFFYDLAVIGNDQYLVGLPDQEVFELPKLVTGAQAIWHETTGVWLDRQADLRTYLRGTTTPLVTKEGVKAVPGAPASVTPGIWGKVVGSWASRDASNSFSALGSVYGFDTSYSQNIYGFMAGIDFGKENVATSNDAVVFGVLGGYVGSDLSFDSSPTSATYSGGTVGVYATYLTGNWYFDALFKADFLSMDYDAPSLAGVGYFGQSTDARNLGFALDTGYRFYTWGATGFVDALATLSYVNTNISDLALVPSTIVDFGNNDSLRGAIGARVGGQVYDAATYRVEASLTGRLWYEFLGDNAVTIFNPGVPFSTGDNFDGLFGELGVGMNVFAKDSGWNGFVNADVKFGESYTAGSAKGGVRYQW
ncbi:autotransporter outer membrane beta-barrel domain-containing protein [Xanthobacter sp. KR7-65]|uniref:autotransporter outer membrane beta-barrel domain-containing protein n=1 Tax=Xanthobacter sp. KR7-65 TaxID=3156612 RepID=UPI0032B3EBD8